MSIAKAFFVREIVRLRRNIALLERVLNGCAPDDPRCAGQPQMMETEQRCREMLLDLAGHAGDLAMLQSQIRLHYLAAKQQHDRCHQHHPMNAHDPGDEWWSSLGRMQYLCFLQGDLDRLMHRYTAAEVKQEIRRAVRAKDLPRASARAEILRAIARAEGSAVSRAYLVQHDVFPVNGRNEQHAVNGHDR